MCGIVGWIDWNTNLNQKKDILIDMTRVLANRGPDAEGMWLSENAAFGHRRLSVVDPEGGGQPMVKKIGNREYVITYNGELYNTDELRNELIGLGYSFSSHSDTEVLLASYIEWKDKCVKKFNGIYAFGIWDQYEQCLFLGRDHAGVKPLFYSEIDGGFIFASEIKAILQHPLVEPEIDINGISEVFLIGPAVTAGSGVFKGIYELKPGESMIYNKYGKKVERFWKLKSEPHTDDFATTVANVRELLENAVKRQLVSDVPICTFLSGGLDSSTITAFAAKEFKKNGEQLNTFSINYQDNEKYFKPNSFEPDSDSNWVKRVSDEFGTKHHYITIDTPQLVEALETAVNARDLPGMVDIDSSLYLFCKEVKKNATVALSGD